MLKYNNKILNYAFKAGQFAGVVDTCDGKEYDQTLRSIEGNDDFYKSYSAGYHYGWIYGDMRNVRVCVCD